jgi:hypothetical protein
MNLLFLIMNVMKVLEKKFCSAIHSTVRFMLIIIKCCYQLLNFIFRTRNAQNFPCPTFKGFRKR